MQGNQHFILTSKRFNDLDPIVSLENTAQNTQFYYLLVQTREHEGSGGVPL